MAIFRCASCGSPNVMTDTQSGGVKFDYAKGIVGTVVLGAGGAVAGIKNTTQTVYKCPDCGMILTYCMPQEIKTMIDIGVESAAARKGLTLNGTHLDWDYLVKRYKNIEYGRGEEEIREKRKIAEECEMEQQQLITLIAKKVIERIPEIQTEIELFTINTADKKNLPAYHEHIDELQQVWEEKYLPILEQKEAARAEAKKKTDNERKAKVEKIKRNTELEKKNGVRSSEPLLQEKNELQKRLSSLGLFKFGEKKAIQERLDNIQKLLANIEQEKASYAKVCDRTCDRLVSKAYQESRVQLRQLRLSIEEQYPIEESPAHKHRKGAFLCQMINKAKEGHSFVGWESFASIIIYYTVNVLEELAGGLSIDCGIWCIDTNITAQRFCASDSKAIIEIAMPEMCKAFGVDGRAMSNYGNTLDKASTAVRVEKIIEDTLFDFYGVLRKGNDSFYTTNV